MLNSPLLAYALEIVGQRGEAEFHSLPALRPAEMCLQKVWNELIPRASQSPSPLGPVAGKENSVYTLRIYINGVEGDAWVLHGCSDPETVRPSGYRNNFD